MISLSFMDSSAARCRRAWLFSVSFVAFTASGCSEPEPDLDALPNLVAAKQFDEVEKRLAQQLRVHPDDDSARILLAQISLAKPDSNPEQALKALEGVQTKQPSALAIVLLNRGKAYSNLHDYEQAERCWREALKADPKVPEAGWALIGLFYVQGRRVEAQALALKLHETEPDPRDRVQFLLELIRQDAMPLEPASVAANLEAGVKLHPQDLKTTIALARNLIKGSAFDRGLTLLRQATRDHPANPDAWEGLLNGLDAAGKYDEFAKTLASLPATLKASPRFARHIGRDAQEKHRWDQAADAYRTAWKQGARDPELTYRLSRALRLSNRTEEADRFERKAQGMEAAKETILDLYQEANVKIGREFNPSTDHLHVYQRLADHCEQRGLLGQALAWHRLVLKERPGDPISGEAAQRIAEELRQEST